LNTKIRALEAKLTTSVLNERVLEERLKLYNEEKNRFEINLSEKFKRVDEEKEDRICLLQTRVRQLEATCR
jgi:hypothetical protein